MLVKRFVCEDSQEKFDEKIMLLKDLGYRKQGAPLDIKADFTTTGKPAFCQLMIK